ncbi:polysaccharide deacetylase family protein [Actinomadura scrupuli]|uniref:polysaccharide deacetylase family protein n=1 Tax=Actinomadura scrupuli TaxID=559629 RepID=UPI003D96B2A2
MTIQRRGVLGAAVAAAAGLAAGCGPDGRPRARTVSPAGPALSPPAAPHRLPAEVTHGPRAGRQVALTFHGAGEPRLARRLLDELAAGGAHVTVLAVGTWLEENPALARVILDGGHELGNHTQHHGDIAAMSPAAAHAEIAQCADRLVRLTGSRGAWFRPSRARRATPMVRAMAARAGYPTCLSYDLDSADAGDPGPGAVVRTVLGGVRAGSIVSMHFGHPGTLAAMPAILGGLAARRLGPVTVSTLLAS